MIIILLLFLFSLVPPVFAQTQDRHFDFENGIPEASGSSSPFVWPSNAGDAAVPRTVQTELGGNHFLRMAASPSDCGLLFATNCPRTRATVGIGHSTVVTPGRTVAYSWKMRVPGSANNFGANQWGMFMQLFQCCNLPSGQTQWIGNKNGHLYLVNQIPCAQEDEPCKDDVSLGTDLGPIPYDTWHTYSLQLFLSANPALGRMDMFIDGQLVATVTQATMRNETGVIDMDFQIVDTAFVTGTAIFTTADYDDADVTVLPIVQP